MDRLKEKKKRSKKKFQLPERVIEKLNYLPTIYYDVH